MQEKPWGRKSRQFKVHSLIDKVYKLLNLYIAWEKVRAKKGRGGVDKVSIENFEGNLDQNLREIHRLLHENRYKPLPVKRAWIPKPDGNRRPLGIPSIRDRVVQQALLNRLTRIFEPKFLTCSYGFRPNCSTQQAIKKLEEYLENGYQWIVKVDIESYFDTIDHDLLITLINEEVADGRVLRLIRLFLKAGVMEEMNTKYSTTGTPQGGVISPLLANIYLHPFDEAMTKDGYKVIRYADDIIILSRKRQEAEKALNRTRQILEGKLKIKLNTQKTEIVHKTQTFEFLGFLFGYGYTNYKTPRDKAIDSFKDKVRHITRRHQPRSISMVIAELNPVVRGWGNYFLWSNCYRKFRKLDFWMRTRLTAYICKRQGGLKHRKYPYKRLKAMGVVLLRDLLYAKRPELLPAKGRRLRRAVCGKSARTVR